MFLGRDVLLGLVIIIHLTIFLNIFIDIQRSHTDLFEESKYVCILLNNNCYYAFIIILLQII